MKREMAAVGRWAWISLMVGVGLEFVLGVAALLLVPVGRADEWVPPQGRAVYLAHAGLGGLLGIGALVAFLAVAGQGRLVILGARIGLVGLLGAAAGGILTVFHPWRFAGLALMFAGSFVAFFGFLIPLLEQDPGEESENGRAPSPEKVEGDEYRG